MFEKAEVTAVMPENLRHLPAVHCSAKIKKRFLQSSCADDY